MVQINQSNLNPEDEQKSIQMITAQVNSILENYRLPELTQAEIEESIKLGYEYDQ
jgi:hypothetical protein